MKKCNPITVLIMSSAPSHILYSLCHCYKTESHNCLCMSALQMQYRNIIALPCFYLFFDESIGIEDSAIALTALDTL